MENKKFIVDPNRKEAEDLTTKKNEKLKDEEFEKEMKLFWASVYKDYQNGDLTLTQNELNVDEPPHIKQPAFNTIIWQQLDEIDVIRNLTALNHPVDYVEGKHYKGKKIIGFYEADNTTTQTRGSIFGGKVIRVECDAAETRKKMQLIGRDTALEKLQGKLLRQSMLFPNSHGRKEAINTKLIQRDQSGVN